VKNLKKWRSGQIHRLFLLFYHVFIAGIFNHYEARLARFWFDVYSPRYLHEQKVSDFTGSMISCKTIISCAPVPHQVHFLNDDRRCDTF
jgi:hypothetical protein